MFLRSERFPRNHYNMSLAQQLRCQVRSGLDLTFTKEGLDVRIHIESTFRNSAGKAWNRLEAFQYAVAELDVVGTHFRDAIL